jgi:hypothetical protein
MTEDAILTELRALRAASWSERARGWVALVDTGGWEPGTWAARGHVRGLVRGVHATGWAWQEVPILALPGHG